MVGVIKKVCTVSDCARPLIARGLCTLHYQRMRSHGSTDKPQRPKVPTPHGTLQGYNFHRCRCEECSAAQRSYQVRWKAEMADRCKEYELRHAYGMTKFQYDELLQGQGGVCAICDEERLPRGRKFMDVDHDHTTGEVRGILCNACNQDVGRMERRIANRPGVLEYLGWRRD